MKSLLFTLGLALCCFVQADEDQRFENIDLTSLPRDGIVAAMITNCQDLKEMFAKIKAFHISFEKLSEDEVQMTIDIATSKGCKTMKQILSRENGVFNIKCGKSGTKTMEYTYFNEDNSMFNSLTFTRQNVLCKVASLTVADLAHIPGALEGFRAFADRRGMEDEEIQDLSTEGMCEPSS